LNNIEKIINMKKLILLLSIIAIVITQNQLVGQTVEFRITNPKIAYGPNPGVDPDSLVFDVDVRCNVAGTFHRNLFLAITYPSNAFGSSIVTNGKISVKKLTLAEGELVAGFPYYNIGGPTDNQPNRLVVGTTSAFGTSTNQNVFNEVPTSFTSWLRISIVIADNTQDAEIVYDQSTMDGQQSHQNFTVAGPILYNIPNLYDADLNLLWLGAVYSNNSWTPLNPDATTGSLNASIWEGTGSITAPQATYAFLSTVRVHDQSSTSINDAYLSIAPGAGLTVSGTLENPIPEGVIIQSDATGTGSLIPNLLSGAGTYGVERYYAENTVVEADYYFHQVAAPVANQVLQDFDLIPGQSYAFQYNGTTNQWENIYAYTRPTDLGYGFILSTYNNNVAQTNYFTDDILAADISIPITAGVMNLVGNPYPSPIDWGLIITDPLNSGGVVDAVYIWNETLGNYYSYVHNTTTGNLSCRYIQLGQSAFIESGTATSLEVETTHRVHNDQPYLKEDHMNYMRLYTQGGNGTQDELYIRFMDDEAVTNAYEKSYDALDWPSVYAEMATEIYTVSSDGQNLTIDVRPALEDELVSIPLAFKAGAEATYSFGTEFLESFYSGISIMLEDKSFPGADWFDMRSGENYGFSASPADPYDRFVLHFFDQAFGVDDLSVEPVKIYSHRSDAIIVNNSEQRIREVLVYDMMGNLLVNKVTVNASPLRFHVSDQTGYYVVKVITDKAVYSEKVLISK